MFCAYILSFGCGRCWLVMIFFADLSLCYAENASQGRFASRTLVALQEGISPGLTTQDLLETKSTLLFLSSNLVHSADSQVCKSALLPMSE